jgi:iron(III) transport system substrate-binding protein
MKRLTGLLILLAAITGCNRDPRPEIWIYSSIYREIQDLISPQLDATFPDLNIRWYKAGSEEVAARVTAELAAGRSRADIILTADISWYETLKQEGHLLRLTPQLLAQVYPKFRDPGGYYTTSRAGVMVLCVNPRLVPPELRPRSFKDLADPRYRGKLVMPDPLRSGTSFITVSTLSRKYGWDYFKALRANETIVEGGNTAVLRRIENGDRPVGIILMENILKARTTGSPAEMILPADGAVVIPCPIAILASCDRPDDARRIAGYFLSRMGQEAMVRGFMYPVDPKLPGPAHAPTFQELMSKASLLDPPAIQRLTTEADNIKETFMQVMFE